VTIEMIKAMYRKLLNMGKLVFRSYSRVCISLYCEVYASLRPFDQRSLTIFTRMDVSIPIILVSVVGTLSVPLSTDYYICFMGTTSSDVYHKQSAKVNATNIIGGLFAVG